jgi:hypothetical protein
MNYSRSYLSCFIYWCCSRKWCQKIAIPSLDAFTGVLTEDGDQIISVCCLSWSHCHDHTVVRLFFCYLLITIWPHYTILKAASFKATEVQLVGAQQMSFKVKCCRQLIVKNDREWDVGLNRILRLLGTLRTQSVLDEFNGNEAISMFCPKLNCNWFWQTILKIIKRTGKISWMPTLF